MVLTVPDLRRRRPASSLPTGMLLQPLKLVCCACAAYAAVFKLKSWMSATQQAHHPPAYYGTAWAATDSVRRQNLMISATGAYNICWRSFWNYCTVHSTCNTEQRTSASTSDSDVGTGPFLELISGGHLYKPKFGTGYGTVEHESVEFKRLTS